MSAQINEQSDLLYQIMGWAEEKPTIALLQALEQTGSINKAAQSMGIQYRTAWQKICQLNNLLPYLCSANGSAAAGEAAQF